MSGGNGKRRGNGNGHARIDFPQEMLNGNGRGGRYSVSRKGMGGRPSKYTPNACDVVVDGMAEGMSRYEIARELNVMVGTLGDWEKKYPEFQLALKMGEGLSRGWWEKQARTALHLGIGDKFSTGPWLINMINRFGWRSANAAIKEEIKTEVTQSKRVEHVLKLEGVSDTVLLQVLRTLSTAKSPEGKTIAAEPVRSTLH